MTERSTRHATFTVERLLAAAPSRVFAAYADRKTKARWFIGPEGWERSDHRLDFRVGGRESVRGGPPGGPTRFYNGIYQDIVPDERIVLTYEMHLDAMRLSVSLGTTEFRAAARGTRLVYTEQAVFLDGHDDARSREPGIQALLDRLVKSLDGKVP